MFRKNTNRITYSSTEDGKGVDDIDNICWGEFKVIDESADINDRSDGNRITGRHGTSSSTRRRSNIDEISRARGRSDTRRVSPRSTSTTSRGMRDARDILEKRRNVDESDSSHRAADRGSRSSLNSRRSSDRVERKGERRDNAAHSRRPLSSREAGRYEKDRSGEREAGRYEKDRSGEREAGRYEKDRSGERETGRYEKDSSGERETGCYEKDRSGGRKQKHWRRTQRNEDMGLSRRGHDISKSRGQIHGRLEQPATSSKLELPMKDQHGRKEEKTVVIDWNKFTRIVFVEDSRLQLAEKFLENRIKKAVRVLTKPFLTLEDVPAFVAKNVKKTHEHTLLICTAGIGNLIQFKDVDDCKKLKDHDACKNMHIQEKDAKEIAQHMCKMTKFVKNTLQLILGSNTEVIFTSILPLDFLIYQFNQMKMHQSNTGHQLDLEFRQRDIVPWNTKLLEAIALYNGFLKELEEPFNMMKVDEWICSGSGDLTMHSMAKKMVDGVVLTASMSKVLHEALSVAINNIFNLSVSLKDSGRRSDYEIGRSKRMPDDRKYKTVDRRADRNGTRRDKTDDKNMESLLVSPRYPSSDPIMGPSKTVASTKRNSSPVAYGERLSPLWTSSLRRRDRTAHGVSDSRSDRSPLRSNARHEESTFGSPPSRNRRNDPVSKAPRKTIDSVSSRDTFEYVDDRPHKYHKLQPEYQNETTSFSDNTAMMHRKVTGNDGDRVRDGERMYPERFPVDNWSRDDRGMSSCDVTKPASALASNDKDCELVCETLVLLCGLDCLGPLKNFVKRLHEKVVKQKYLGLNIREMLMGDEKDLLSFITNHLKNCSRNLSIQEKAVVEECFIILNDFMKSSDQDVDIITLAPQCVGKRTSEVHAIIRKHLIQNNLEVSDERILEIDYAVQRELNQMEKWALGNQPNSSFASDITELLSLKRGEVFPMSENSIGRYKMETEEYGFPGTSKRAYSDNGPEEHFASRDDVKNIDFSNNDMSVQSSAEAERRMWYLQKSNEDLLENQQRRGEMPGRRSYLDDVHDKYFDVPRAASPIAKYSRNLGGLSNPSWENKGNSNRMDLNDFKPVTSSFRDLEYKDARLSDSHHMYN